jgi:hypothetical protein
LINEFCLDDVFISLIYTRDIPPFEIFGTSIEFYLKCMICNQNGFQFVLSFGFEDCDEPHIEGKSSFFSVYQKLDHGKYLK